MGIRCEEVPELDGIKIYPGEIKETEVETYEDHRMAMAFTLVGLKTGKITIKNPGCCRKTFENYFELIDSLYKQAGIFGCRASGLQTKKFETEE